MSYRIVIFLYIFGLRLLFRIFKMHIFLVLLFFSYLSQKSAEGYNVLHQTVFVQNSTEPTPGLRKKYVGFLVGEERRRIPRYTTVNGRMEAETFLNYYTNILFFLLVISILTKRVN